MLWRVSVLYLFIAKLYSVAWIHHILFIHGHMDVSAVSTFWQFGVMLLLQTLRYKFCVGCCCSVVSDCLSGYMFSSLLGIRLRLQGLGHIVTLCLIL